MDQRNREIVERQFGYEFDLSPSDFARKHNVFVARKPDPSFRFWGRSAGDILCYRGKILVRIDNDKALEDVREEFGDFPGEWFFEKDNIPTLSEILKKYGLRICNRAPFFVPSYQPEADADYKVVPPGFRWIEKEEIPSYQKDKRIVHAFGYDETDPDEIGIAYSDGDKLIAIAGVSRMAKHMWEFGVERIEKDPMYHGKGTELIHLLTNRILIEHPDVIPVYGTQFSNTTSMNTAIRAGFEIGWTELMIDHI